MLGEVCYSATNRGYQYPRSSVATDLPLDCMSPSGRGNGVTVETSWARTVRTLLSKGSPRIAECILENELLASVAGVQAGEGGTMNVRCRETVDKKEAASLSGGAMTSQMTRLAICKRSTMIHIIEICTKTISLPLVLQ